ncbi:MAG: hypothetical protein HPY75_12005 [Actinobacteria bacterium]|nr:hypothetical protein [Actinomycetota bacterium]
MGRAGHSADITLSSRDIVFLAGLFGGTELVGIRDPFRGRPAEDVDKELKSTRDSLVERGLISISGEDVAFLDPDLQAAVGAIARPACTLIVHRSGSGAGATKFFHVSRYYSVSHPLQEDENELTLHLVSTVTQAARELLGALSLPRSDLTPRGEPFTCRTDGFLALLRGASPDMDLLATFSDDFKTSLAENWAYTSLVCLDRSKEPANANVIGFFYTDNSLWKIEPALGGKDSKVTVRPCGNADAMASIRRDISEYLPELSMRLF